MNPDAPRGTLDTSPLSVDELRRQYARAGWRVGVVSGPRTSREALDAIGRALAFPAYYGRNLDALWDCLGDLPGPSVLIWDGWEPFALFAPDEWSPILRVLADRVHSGRPVAFSVVLVVPPPRPDTAPDAVLPDAFPEPHDITHDGESPDA